MKVTKFLISLLCMSVLLLTGCGSQAPGFSPPGSWETVRQFDYYGLSKEQLKGDLGPAYLVYMVTVAGFHTETYGITVGPDDDARFTTDGGQSWTKAPSGLHCRFGLDIVDEKTAWHCGNGGTRVTTDGGQTWQTVADSPCPSLSFLDDQTGWAASPGTLQATHDGGASWERLVLPAGAGEIAAVSLLTPAAGYVLDVAGTLFVTADGGQHWKQHSLGLRAGERLLVAGVPDAVMRFVDAQNGIVVFDLSDGTVWFAVTKDGGGTWERAEITGLRGKSLYYHLYLSHDGRLLTVTDDFNNGENVSTLLRYRQR